jgi:hypothetical protein
MLDALAGIFDEASLLVTFNGRTFDVPFMDMRWAFHRRECPTTDLPHFDMLPPARRLWSRRDDDEEQRASCSMRRSALGARFHRLDDVPGFEIGALLSVPADRRCQVIEGVLEHNRDHRRRRRSRHGRSNRGDGPEMGESSGGSWGSRGVRRAVREGPRLRAGLVRDQDVAHAACPGWPCTCVVSRFGEAAAAWARISTARDATGRPSPIERRATEALAIHHDTARDPTRRSATRRPCVPSRPARGAGGRTPPRAARPQDEGGGKQKGSPQAAFARLTVGPPARDADFAGAAFRRRARDLLALGGFGLGRLRSCGGLLVSLGRLGAETK